jgi:hypothetical protein
MKWVRDRTRRFEWRPFYTQQEIDIQCEDLVSSFLRDKSGSSTYPIRTDDLTVMIERDVSDLDLYTNLSSEGRGVEGVTEFHRGQKPSVRIAAYLSAEPKRENRLRTTLAHEYGHVVFHNFLWTFDRFGPQLRSNLKRSPRCRRARIVGAPQTDWIEWQAGYAGGALLMPATPVGELVGETLRERGTAGLVEPGTDHHQELVNRVAGAFAVSKDAAKFRLLKLGYVRPASGE